MLAEKKKRVKWSLNPRGNLWSQDSNKFGQRMLEKYGWKEGSGLGVNQQGITEHIKVTYKSDNKCIGYKENGEEWIEQQSQFEKMLAELSNSHNNATSLDEEKGNESLEQKSRESRARVHYQKFTRGKDLSKRSTKELACILGVRKTDVNLVEEKTEEGVVDSGIGEVNDLYGVTTIKGGNMNDYFSKIKNKFESNVQEQMTANEEIKPDDNFQISEKNTIDYNDTAGCINLVNNKHEPENEAIPKKKKKKHNPEETINTENNNVNFEVKMLKKKQKSNHLSIDGEMITITGNEDCKDPEIDCHLLESDQNKVDKLSLKKKHKKKKMKEEIKISETIENEIDESDINASKEKTKKKNNKIKENKEVVSHEILTKDGTSMFNKKRKCEMSEENEVDISSINPLKKKRKKDLTEVNELIDLSDEILEANKSNTDVLMKKDEKDVSEKRVETLEPVEIGMGKCSTNTLKKKTKKKSDEIVVNEVIDDECLEIVKVNTSKQNASKKKHKYKNEDIKEELICEIVDIVEELDTRNSNILKEKRKTRKNDVSEENREVILEIAENELDADVPKKKRNKKNGVDEVNEMEIEILEIDENQVDKNNPKFSKKKKKNGMFEENGEAVKVKILEILEKEIVTNNSDISKKKRKKKNVIENEEGEIVEIINKEIDSSNLGTLKTKTKKKNGMLKENGEEIDDGIIIIDQEVDTNSKEVSKRKRKTGEIAENEVFEIVTENSSKKKMKKKNGISKEEEVVEDEILKIDASEVNINSTDVLKKRKSSISQESILTDGNEKVLVPEEQERRYSTANMKISEFRKLLCPSLIDFGSSNLHKIKGYGCN